MSGDDPEWFKGSIPETYHRCLGPILFEFSARELARSVSGELTDRASTVLEVACGTGISTSFLSRQLGPQFRIEATDLNVEMLTLAKDFYPDLPGVRFSQADAQNLGFADQSMDAVICQFGLMFFPDKALALQEFWRVLKPGGLLAVSVWADKSRFPFALIVDEVVARYFASDPPDMTALPYSLGDKGALEGLLRDAGFTALEAHEISGPVEVKSYADFARGLIAGNPTVLEIEKRATATLGTIIAVCVDEVTATLGPQPRAFELPATICLCRKPF